MLTLKELTTYSGTPLVVFVGVSTVGSAIHRLFPLWAAATFPGAHLRGLDLPLDAPQETYRAVLDALRARTDVVGAVVTSHKLRFHHAIAAMNHREAATTDGAAAGDVELDVLASFIGEVNSLRGGQPLRGFARDPESLDLILDQLTTRYGQRPIVCLGAGGAALALLVSLRLDVPASLESGTLVPRQDPSVPLMLVDNNPEPLTHAQALVERLEGHEARHTSLRPVSSVTEVSKLVRSAPADALVINATGLGKFSAKSPLPGPEAFRAGQVAWDFNYRGPLTFLEQAREAGCTAVDGWQYFVAGWAAALAAIAGRPLAKVYPSMLQAAATARRTSSDRELGTTADKGPTHGR